ncbi:MAG: flagellar assembly protein FlaA [Leptospira sp.]|nr:flagellar assembly protein FlaA [Leptospira sp.]
MKPYLIAFAILFCSQVALFAPSRPGERDELGRVQILSEIITKEHSYTLFVAEDFEGENLWKINRGISFLNRTEFISKTPESEAFKLESKLYKDITQRDSRNSLMVQSYFEIPSKETLEIRPNKNIRLPPGIPVRIFVWIFSNDYNMDLSLILSQNRSKDIYLELGEIKFEGWRRIEKKIVLPDRNIRLNLSMQFPFEIKGIKIKPSPFQKRGSFFIYFDQMAVILEKRNTTYSGSEIKDNWGLEY